MTMKLAKLWNIHVLILIAALFLTCAHAANVTLDYVDASGSGVVFVNNNASVTGDDPDLIKFQVTTSRKNATINLVVNNPKVAIWADAKKTTAHSKTWNVSDGHMSNQPNAPSDGTTGWFWVEGLSPSASSSDTVELKVELNKDNKSVDSEKVIVVKASLVSVTYKSDHGVLTKNDDDWTANGRLYKEPEWSSGDAESNPITHNFGEQVKVDVKIKVEPSGVTFDIVGDANIPGCDFQEFLKNSLTSTAADQVENITSTDVLPNVVDRIMMATDYSVRSGQVEFFIESTAVTDAYLTFGAPPGGVATLRRVKTVVEGKARGLNDPSTAADEIWKQLKETNIGYTARATEPNDIWTLYDGAQSKCPGVARFVSAHFQMLGLNGGTIKYCRARPNGTYDDPDVNGTLYEYRSCVAGQNNHVAGDNHDVSKKDEQLVHIDGNADANDFEAAVHAYNKYYALDIADICTTPKDVVLKAFKLNMILWTYFTQNGPISRCTVKPWMQAP